MENKVAVLSPFICLFSVYCPNMSMKCTHQYIQCVQLHICQYVFK